MDKKKEFSYKGDELYATINSLKDFDFGFAYKVGLNNNWFLRFDVINASFDSKDTESSLMVADEEVELTSISNQNSSNFDWGIGIEKRSDFNARLEFLYGVSALGGYNSQTVEGMDPHDETIVTQVKSKTWTYGPA